MDKSDLRIEQLQQYLDQKKEVVESNIKEYNQQLGKNYLHFFDWHARSQPTVRYGYYL